MRHPAHEDILSGSKIKELEQSTLLGVYHVRFGPEFLIPFALLIAPAIGIGMFLSAHTIFEKIASLIFFVVFTAPGVFVISKLVPKLRDELKIYEKGFIYKSPKGIQSCLWSDISDGSFSIRFDGTGIVNSFVKKNGETIDFVYNMQGLDKLNSLYDNEVFREISEEEEKSGAPETIPD